MVGLRGLRGRATRVNEERCCHSISYAKKMLVLLLLHNGLKRERAEKTVGVSRATVQRYVGAFRQGGLDGCGSGISVAR